MTERIINSVTIDGKERQLFAEDGAVKEIFVDGIQGVMLGQGSVKINLYSTGFHDVEGPERREFVGRLVMTQSAFLSIVNVLSDVAKDVSGSSGKRDSK